LVLEREVANAVLDQLAEKERENLLVVGRDAEVFPATGQEAKDQQAILIVLTGDETTRREKAKLT
jgi:hypothetical protein